MITPASLKAYRLKDLAQLARKRGVAGWHSMNKEQLIRSLTSGGGDTRRTGSQARSAESRTSSAKGLRRPAKVAAPQVSKEVQKVPPPKAVSKVVVSKGATVAKKDTRGKVTTKPKNPRVVQKIQRENARRDRLRDLTTPALTKVSGQNGKEVGERVEAQRDRIVLLVRDAYWLHACWEITRQSVQRAQAAMAEHWHTASPVLRVLEVENTGTTSSAERIYREIPIHGGVQNWYIDVQDPPKSFRVDLGYRASNGKFYAMVKSNSVTTPKPGSADALDENWSDVAENAEKIFAQSGGYAEENNSFALQELFEERLQRPMGSPLMSRFGSGAERMVPRRRDFQFDVDAEMIVFGTTKPDAHVTLSGEPVKLRPDGSFTVRLAMPDKRQVIPIVAASRDGLEQRTVVIAIERNTKVMEPMIRESSE